MDIKKKSIEIACSIADMNSAYTTHSVYTIIDIARIIEDYLLGKDYRADEENPKNDLEEKLQFIVEWIKKNG